MMRRAAIGIALLLALLVRPADAGSPPAVAGESTRELGRFGTVHLYAPAQPPRNVILFLSGDGGWEKGVIAMSRFLVEHGAAVAGVDVPHYRDRLAASQERCAYPAGELEELSKQAQRMLGLAHYRKPILIGFSSGATLAYAALVQAPEQTFLGAISLGFCPDFALERPICPGNGLSSRPLPKGQGVLFEPARSLRANPWVALHGQRDEMCPIGVTRSFVRHVDGGQLVTLPAVGHGFAVRKEWAGPLRDAVQRLARTGPPASTDAQVSDLPLVENPAPGSTRDELAVLVSGDGGWAGIDRALAGALASAGIPVIGLDSLQYFWSQRTPEQAGRDLQRVLVQYLRRWRREKIVLVGYSLGADVLPFMASRLPPPLRERVELVALLGPSRYVDFEFHVSDWLGGSHQDDARPVAPELAKLRGLPLLCVYGTDEQESLCPQLPAGLATLDPIEGGHHFGGEYTSIARRILEFASAPERGRNPQPAGAGALHRAARPGTPVALATGAGLTPAVRGPEERR
jgi:type IV secretory pathway VirJ component